MTGLVREAAARMRGVVSRTPVIYSSSLSRLFGFECLLKLENLQKTGSFKARGAYFKISSLTDAEKAAGVVAASSGNHGQGVAWACSLLGVKSLIVMPESAPISKLAATRGYGGEVLLHGRNFFESYGFARELAARGALAFIHPFDDYEIMAGQGTVGLEILEDAPDADAVVAPVGGGGLISGIAAAVKEARPDVTVVGVEAAASSSCVESIKAGSPTEAAQRPTLADGIAVKRVGDKTFEVIRRLVDRVVDVGEDSIAGAMVLLLERKKLVVEGAGALPVAAAMEGKLPGSTRKAVFVISGGNIDITTLDRVIRRGLLREGRVLSVAVVIPDEPGALAALAAEIAALRANVAHVVHQREVADVPLGYTRLDITLEVEGPAHSGRILAALREKGYMA